MYLFWVKHQANNDSKRKESKVLEQSSMLSS